MLKIWGRISSINVQKVVWCARECGIAFDRIDAGGTFGLVNTAQYRAMNPNAKVPTIDDQGFVLWESNAIVRYLAARYAPGSLCPDGLAERADADRWMDWAAVELEDYGVERFFGSFQMASARAERQAGFPLFRPAAVEGLALEPVPVTP